MDFDLPRTLGKYTLTRHLGRGGMGVVYAGRDEKLGREVAIKLIDGLSSEASVKRFWREARAAASVSHPNVCQIYEVDESADGVYLAMELLAGESLEQRLARGPCTPAEAVHITLQMLAAVAVLHERGIVHRDVKPSNVFLTPHGVKLLDFGLARPMNDATLKLDGATTADEQITRPGMVVGTPRYMAPEQITGEAMDGRADIYAVGTVLFEMLAGRAPFHGTNFYDLAQAVLNENPPALQGSPEIIAADRIIRHALAKDPRGRYATAQAMADELRQISVSDATVSGVIAVRTLLRLVVPPLRLLREDADASFLSYGLAEGLSATLSALKDVVVRAPSVAAQWIETGSDPRRLAAEADVDIIVSGSIVRMGEQLRATVQLIEARSGTVVGATTVRGIMTDIFAFEDQLTQRVLELLAPMHSAAPTEDVHRDVPANGKAFEHFLRGLELTRSLSKMREARVCFESALREDPVFAPAWAWIGRCHRVVGKYEEEYETNDRAAEEAFRRALALSPDLPVAHRFFTHWQSEHGAAEAAIGRLLQHARANRNDAQLFAALVHACRYAGLLGASLAAHDEAKRLDPTVPTSVEYSLLLAGDLERLKQISASTDVQGAHAYLLLFAGRTGEIEEMVARVSLDQFPPRYRMMMEALIMVHTSRDRSIEAIKAAMANGAMHDPEAVFLAGMMSAYLGEADTAMQLLESAVRDGFAGVHPLEQSETLAAVRSRSEFTRILESAKNKRHIALAIFERGGGPALLGIRPEAA